MWHGEFLGAEQTMLAFWLLLEECLPLFAPPLAPLSGQFFRFWFAFEGVLKADALAPQKLAIAVQSFLDVGGGCFMRTGVHDELRALALKRLICLA